LVKKEIAWDLSEIFPSATDPSVHRAIDHVCRIADEFAEKYRGKIEDLSSSQLLNCLQEYEEYQAKLSDVTLFAGLRFAANMTLKDTQILYDKSNKTDARLSKKLAFFQIELGALTLRKPKIVSDPALKTYRHTLERVKRQASHQLSEVEEQLVIEKDQYGVKAWDEMQSKWLNTRMFEIMVEGKKKKLPFNEAIGLGTHPDRRTRESAFKSVYGHLSESGEIFASALRNICNDWVNVSERRRFASPMDASLIENDIERTTVDNLLKTVTNNRILYWRYLKLKAKLMGLPKLWRHDLMAPLPGTKKTKITYEKAQDLVTRAYITFDEEYATAVKYMFKKNHLDSSPRLGKQNGAFCAGWYTGKTSFILNTFNGRLRDVFTLAHELGHATHDYYSERAQTPLNLRLTMVVAETASIFGELLLTDLLLGEAKSDEEKRSVLCSVLDGAGAVIFGVSARALCEQNLYDALRKGEFLSYDTICKYSLKAREAIYGNSVRQFREMDSDWIPIPHYYMANFRFYNYPYVYAQLFVYALYQKYLREGEKFVPKFKKILAAGSRISPAQVGKLVDLDISDPHFWKLGMKQFEYFVKELERIGD
jgi:oligoendopeptidase F